MEFVTKAETEKLVRAYGKNAQRTHAIQEMAELIQEITKTVLYEKDEENYLEELADVYNVLDEIRHIEGFSEREIKRIARLKMDKALIEANEYIE